MNPPLTPREVELESTVRVLRHRIVMLLALLALAPWVGIAFTFYLNQNTAAEAHAAAIQSDRAERKAAEAALYNVQALPRLDELLRRTQPKDTPPAMDGK